MAERVTSVRDGRLAAEAESVVVHLDPETGKSRPLTEEIRAAFSRWLLSRRLIDGGRRRRGASSA